MVNQLFEYTFYAIVLFWVLTHAQQFGTVMASLTSAVQSGTRSLWGFR